jgi:formylmethanofuran dehydrogenase subunit D
LSDEFYGNIIESKKNISAYLKELGELKIKYQELKSLCIDEIS